MKLNDKVAIVTGSAANIGKATALLFAKEGAKVVVTTRSNTEGGRSVVEEITKAGGQAMFVQADLTKPDEVERLFAEAIDAYGTVNILINNAGTASSKPFLETDREYWVKSFDDNLFSMVLCSQAAAKAMQKTGGVILNTTSIRGIEHTGREGIMAYSAAKAASISFTKTLAKELAPSVRVNGVAPGFVITPNYDQSSPTVQAMIKDTLLKRWIQPVEIAEAFLYLATAEAVTGENLVVDGGFTLK